VRCARFYGLFGKCLVVRVVMTLIAALGAGTAVWGNLITNPDAETADTGGWTDPDDAWSARAELTPHGGDYHFWPYRKDLPQTTMYQDVDVSPYADIIDSGNAYLHLSGWLANWDQYPRDQSTLAIQAMSADGHQLLYLSRSHRDPKWTRYVIQARVPSATRTLRVLLVATRYVGTDNDGYFDDLSLEVDTNAPTVFVTIAPASGEPRVEVGSTLQLTATTTGGTDSSYIWASSFEAIASVGSTGLVTAHQAGRFTIQAEGESTHAVGYIELVAYAENYVVFLEPQEGAEWLAGAQQNVTWDLVGDIGEGTLYYSSSGGGSWTEVAQIPDMAAGQYTWQAPHTDSPLNTCLLKMTWDGGEALSSIFSVVPAGAPEISIAFYAGITIHGTVGHTYAVQYVSDMGQTDWMTLDAVTLTESPQIWFDVDSVNRRKRFYRVVKQ